MIRKVTRYQTPDGVLFDSYEDAEEHHRFTMGTAEANDALWNGVSLYHALRLTSSRCEYEIFKLAKRNFLIQLPGRHIKLNWLRNPYGISCWVKPIDEGMYSRDGGYSEDYSLPGFRNILKFHVERNGFSSAAPVKEHW